MEETFKDSGTATKQLPKQVVIITAMNGYIVQSGANTLVFKFVDELIEALKDVYGMKEVI